MAIHAVSVMLLIGVHDISVKVRIYSCAKKINTGDYNYEESSNSPSSDTDSDSEETGKEEDNITPMLLVATMTCISQPKPSNCFTI